MSLRPKPILVETLKLFSLEAKLQAYNKALAILSKGRDQLTDMEIEIGFALCCDADVQDYISKNLPRFKSPEEKKECSHCGSDKTEEQGESGEWFLHCHDCGKDTDIPKVVKEDL